MDAELDRKIAHNWKDYLKETRQMKDMAVWVWKEMLNPKCRFLAKKMFVMMAIGCAIDVATPWILSLVFNGLAPKSFSGPMVIAGLAIYGAATILARIIQCKRMSCRELMFAERGRQLDKRTTELFFEKSLGTHIAENNLLNEANIKKGYERIIQLEDIMLFQGFQIIVYLLLAFFALWFISWVSAAMIGMMIFIHLAWSLFLNQKVMEVCVPLDRQWRALQRFRVERWNQVERVKNNNKERDELAELGRKFNDAIVPDLKFWLWFIIQTVKRGLVDDLILAAVMVYGVYEVWHGWMTVGLLYPLFSWARQFTDNLWQIGNLEHQINFAAPSIMAMKTALTLPCGLAPPDKPSTLPEKTPCRVEFRNVGYCYPGQKDEDGDDGSTVAVLEKISFAIEPGEKVALIGSSGAGKTTIMRLLLRYMDPSEGIIEIDGADLRDLKPESWLRQIGYVPQETQILDGTIRYNLLYGLPDAEKNRVSDDELWKIMKLLQIDFGERLTHGLDTQVGRNGIKLSGGQAQRIMIGAAVMKNPRFLIIDEATSSLDSTTEKLVQEGLEKILTEDRGALIITHRLNTVRRICNKFILISNNDKGSKVIAIADSFEELAELSPEFRSLAKDQGIEL